MNHIPARLVSSLKTLGLFESEAKVYSALVLMKYAQAKELVEFLDISKPSVYESLRTLEDRGLVVMTNSKPVTYQAIPPEIGIKLLKEVYEKASVSAEQDLVALERQNIEGKSDVALWSLYGQETIEYKQEDMLKHASKSIYCIMPERYIPNLEKVAGKGLKIHLLAISDDPDMQRRLEEKFKGDDANIRIINYDRLVMLFASYKSGIVPGMETVYKDAMSVIDMNNLFILVTDGSELLYVMPIVGGMDSALNSTNKGMIALMNIFFNSYGNML